MCSVFVISLRCGISNQRLANSLASSCEIFIVFFFFCCVSSGNQLLAVMERGEGGRGEGGREGGRREGGGW